MGRKFILKAKPDSADYCFRKALEIAKKQQNINTNSIEVGLMIQRDINNISLNIKNEIFVSSKLKSILKNSQDILYSSEINA